MQSRISNFNLDNYTRRTLPTFMVEEPIPLQRKPFFDKDKRLFPTIPSKQPLRGIIPIIVIGAIVWMLIKR